MNIQNQVFLIAGGASGMGEAVSHHLAEQGAQIIIIDRDADGAQRVAQKCDGLGLACDITKDEDLVQAFNQAQKKFSQGLSGVINCAGIAPAKRMVGKEGPVPLSWFQEVININLVGTFNVMRLAAAWMMQKNVAAQAERGIIINTASVAAFEGQVGQTAYSASKGGVVAMTLPAARELAQFGIRVMTIAPGFIETPMLSKMPDPVRESLLSQTVFPKRFGQAQEYAALVEHIITNSLLNGEVIRLDGAIRMQAN